MPDILASRLFTLTPLLGVGFAIPYQVRSADNGFDWASVKPTRELEYHDCHGGFKCARLQVPLGWSECAVGSSCDNATAWAAIAIITLPAAMSKYNPSFGGTVLINLGGPGGSGIMKTIQGGQTSPSEPTDIITKGGLPPVNAGTVGLKLFYEASKGLSDLCAGAGTDSIFAHVCTESVARDLLEIVDRVNEQKKKSCNKESSDVPKLQYLGVSYGTLLGNSFAFMFPRRVSRMLLNGVVNADDYMQKGAESPFLFDKKLQTSRENPAVDVYNGRIQLVTSHIVKDAIRQMMYQPIVQCELDSKALALAMAGNYSVLLNTAAGNSNTVSQTEMCVQAGASFPPSEFSATNEAGTAIFCGDSYQVPELHNVTWAENTAKHFSEQSATTGESWSQVALSCSGWKSNPKYYATGVVPANNTICQPDYQPSIPYKECPGFVSF